MGGPMKTRKKSQWSIHVIQHVSGEGRQAGGHKFKTTELEQTQSKGMFWVDRQNVDGWTGG